MSGSKTSVSGKEGPHECSKLAKNWKFLRISAICGLSTHISASSHDRNWKRPDDAREREFSNVENLSKSFAELLRQEVRGNMLPQPIMLDGQECMDVGWGIIRPPWTARGQATLYMKPLEDEAKKWSVCYISTMTGNCQGIYYVMRVEDAERFVRDKRTKGVSRGHPWAYFQTSIFNFIQREGGGGSRRPDSRMTPERWIRCSKTSASKHSLSRASRT